MILTLPPGSRDWRIVVIKAWEFAKGILAADQVDGKSQVGGESCSLAISRIVSECSFLHQSIYKKKKKIPVI